MANALGPYYVRINYHGFSAPHTMTIPTTVWSELGGTNGHGTFLAWNASDKDAEDMINELVTLMLPFFNSDTVFDNWIIYRQLNAEDDPEPVSRDVFTAMVGTNSGASWASAVQGSIIAGTEDFGIAKLILLDACSENDFNPILVPNTALTNLTTEWFSATSGWSGRDNSRPNVFLKYTLTLNEKLRKEYRLD